MSPGTCDDMRSLVATTVHAFLRDIMPQLYPAPWDGQAVEVTLNGFADAIKLLEKEAGKPLQTALATILLDNKE